MPYMKFFFIILRAERALTLPFLYASRLVSKLVNHCIATQNNVCSVCHTKKITCRVLKHNFVDIS